MHKLAKFIIDSRKIILILFIAAACMSAYTMRLTTVQNDLYQFLPAETDAARPEGDGRRVYHLRDGRPYDRTHFV